MTVEEMEAARRQAVQLVRAFLAGPDRSMFAAAQIENALDAAFPDDLKVQDLIICLACYRPEGGPNLYNEAEMVELLSRYLSTMMRETPM